MVNALSFISPRAKRDMPLAAQAMVSGTNAPAGATPNPLDGLQGGAAAPPMAPQPAKRPVNPLGGIAGGFLPQKRAPNALDAFVDTLQRGIDKSGAQARDAREKTAEQTKLEQGLAFVQRLRMMPAEQRIALAHQGTQQFGLSQIDYQPEQLSDAALDQGIAAISAQLGMAPEKPAGPDYQFLQGPDGAISRGDKTSGGLVAMQPGTPKADTANWQEYTDASGQLWQINPQTGEPRKVDVPRARVPGSDGAGGGETWRDMTPAEIQALGYPEGTVGQRSSTGKVQVDRAAKPQSDYTPTQQNKFIQQAQVYDSIDGALKTYTDLIDEYGPTLWTTGLGGDNPVAKKLDAARTAILIQAKELFNLGVLNGPDLDIIGGAVPDVTGWDANGKSKDSAKAQLGILNDYIVRGRNQIPPQFLDKARPNGAPGGSGLTQPPAAWQALGGYRQGVGRPSAQPQADDANTPPAGVTPEEWQHMTPEDRALFQ